MAQDVDFARLVGELRQRRDWTQEQLARDLGVAFSTVNAWENGRHRPIPVLARRLLELAGEASVEVHPVGSAAGVKEQ